MFQTGCGEPPRCHSEEPDVSGYGCISAATNGTAGDVASRESASPDADTEIQRRVAEPRADTAGFELKTITELSGADSPVTHPLSRPRQVHVSERQMIELAASAAAPPPPLCRCRHCAARRGETALVRGL